MTPTQHVHKYELMILGGERIVRENGKKKLVRTGGYPVMKCILPNCTHYVQRQLALGRMSICWVCNIPMEMKKYNIREKFPKHKECRKGAKKKQLIAGINFDAIGL